jgi:bifunctional oligoribonuclease and PAP phosphatase NrnA
MSDQLQATIRQMLATASRILIVSHIRPDGDAVGSVLGLGLALQAGGKAVQMVLEDGVPGDFRRLPGAEQICKRAEGPYDCLVALDCSDLERMGAIFGQDQPLLAGQPGIPSLNIDHHVTNENFANCNLVEVKAVATAEIIASHLAEWGLSLTQPVASALLNGIVSDTLGFRTSNMTPQVMRIAANLMEAGADLPELYRQALNQRTFQGARYWGAGLSRLQREGTLVWTVLTQSDRRAAGYPGRDDADLINVLSTINDADISVIFVEQNNGSVKVSWRAQPGYNVSQVAVDFGGGGHIAASGAEIEGSLEEVQEKVLHATRKLFG